MLSLHHGNSERDVFYMSKNMSPFLESVFHVYDLGYRRRKRMIYSCTHCTLLFFIEGNGTNHNYSIAFCYVLQFP